MPPKGVAGAWHRRYFTYDDIMPGVSALRNPRLGNILYRLNLIETYGMGLTKIRNSYQGNPLQPKIQVSDNAFKINLPNHNEASNAKGYHLIKESPFPDLVPKEARMDVIRALFERKDWIVRKDIEEARNIS